MSNIRARKQIQKLADELSKDPVVHFTKCHIECLLKMYSELVKGNKKMDKTSFRDILLNQFGFTDIMMMDRIFRTFDKDSDSFIGMKEWIEGLSVFLRGTLEEKMKFCFGVYDMNNDDYISRDEMYQFLKHTLVRNVSDDDPEEGVKELVDMAWRLLDVDKDGHVTFDNYQKAVKGWPEKEIKGDNLLLEILGSCLPSEQQCKAFEATFT